MVHLQTGFLLQITREDEEGYHMWGTLASVTSNGDSPEQGNTQERVQAIKDNYSDN